MVHYRPKFTDDEARVSCITVALEEEADDWVVMLHDADAKLLHDFNCFMTALR